MVSPIARVEPQRNLREGSVYSMRLVLNTDMEFHSLIGLGKVDDRRRIIVTGPQMEQTV